MATRAAKRASEWDPKYLGMGMVAFTSVAIGVLNIGPIASRLQGSTAEPKVLASGKGGNGFPEHAPGDSQNGVPHMQVAAWALVSVGDGIAESDLISHTLRVVDDAGASWPVRTTSTPDGFMLLIPEGYARVPKALYVEIAFPGKKPSRVGLPPLPKPAPTPKLSLSCPWPDLQAKIAPAQNDRRSRVAVELQVPSLPKGHVLSARQLGSSATMHENVAGEIPIRHSADTGPVSVPLRLYYPATTEAAYLKVREMRPERRRQRITIDDFKPRYKFEQWWFPSTYRTITLPDRERLLLMSTDREVYRAPRHRRESIQLNATPLGDMRIDRLRLVGLTHIGGVPLRVVNPPIWSAIGSKDYQGGPAHFVFEIDYTVYKPVKEATVAVPLPTKEVAALMGSNPASFAAR